MSKDTPPITSHDANVCLKSWNRTSFQVHPLPGRPEPHVDAPVGCSVGLAENVRTSDEPCNREECPGQRAVHRDVAALPALGIDDRQDSPIDVDILPGEVQDLA